MSVSSRSLGPVACLAGCWLVWEVAPGDPRASLWRFHPSEVDQEQGPSEGWGQPGAAIERNMWVDEDLALIERFKSGDTVAFERLVEKYQRTVLNLVIRFTGDVARAEDLAQEVFLRLYRALGTFEAKARFFTYLYRVTLNLCLKERERTARQRTYSLDEPRSDDDARPRELPDAGGSAEAVVASLEEASVVRQAVLSLPAEQREAVILHRFHGLTYEEMTEVLQISLPALKSRLHRAKLALRASLSGYIRGEGP